jgi:hypothetical protein
VDKISVAVRAINFQRIIQAEKRMGALNIRFSVLRSIR